MSRSAFLFAIVLSLSLFGLAQGAHICSNPQDYVGQSLCYNGGYCGECVSFVKVCTGYGARTKDWKRTDKVSDSDVPIGVAIATLSED